jgi:hypothetical protein
MKKMGIVLLIVSFAAIGCSKEGRFVLTQSRQIDVPKTFFERAITYDVDTKAKRYMTNLESLLGQINKTQQPLPDDLILPLYRDADIDRDRRITFAEAVAFYNDCVLRFEDTLGPLKFQ